MYDVGKNTLTKRSNFMTLIKNWTTELRYQHYDKWPEDYIKQLKKQVSQSKWRLNYHVQPETGLLNDPNGFSFFNGKWHLFYQSYPMGAVHGLKSWFHLTSTNLIDWQKEGADLLPDSPYDSHGVYSGSAFPLDNRLFLAYTGNVRDNDWNRFSYQMGAWMDQNNQIEKVQLPLIEQPPKGYTQHFRDPQIFVYQNKYFMVIGAQNEALEGKVLTYMSTDLQNWELQGELDFSEHQMGFMVECPNLVFVDGKALLLFCPQGLEKEILPYQNIYPNTYVVANEFDSENNRLTNPSSLKNLDEGFDVYATQAFNAPDGRALAVSWIGLPEITYPTDREGWAHCLSLTKELTIKNGVLFQNPVAETKDLREKEYKLHGQLHAEPQAISTSIENQYELNIEFEQGAKGKLTLLADQKENTGLELSFDTERGTMIINRENVGISFAEEYGNQREFSIPQGPLSLRVFVDSSVVEIFINDGEKTATARVFPKESKNDILLSGSQSSFSGKLWTLRSTK